MKTINAIDLLAIADDYEDYKVRVCIQELAFQMGKDNETFLHFWKKRNTNKHEHYTDFISLSEYVEMYRKNTADYPDKELNFLMGLSDYGIINLDGECVEGANITAIARGLAFNSGDEVILTVKGVSFIESLPI